MCASVLFWPCVSGRWLRGTSAVHFKETWAAAKQFIDVNMKCKIIFHHLYKESQAAEMRVSEHSLSPLAAPFCGNKQVQEGKPSCYSSPYVFLVSEPPSASWFGLMGSFCLPLVDRDHTSSLWIRKAPVLLPAAGLILLNARIRLCVFICRLAEWESEGEVRGWKWRAKQWTVLGQHLNRSQGNNSNALPSYSFFPLQKTLLLSKCIFSFFFKCGQHFIHACVEYIVPLVFERLMPAERETISLIAEAEVNVITLGADLKEPFPSGSLMNNLAFDVS